jgi:hypothetical protein
MTWLIGRGPARGATSFTGAALFAGGSASEPFATLRTFETLPDATVVHPGHDHVGRAVQ